MNNNRNQPWINCQLSTCDGGNHEQKKKKGKLLIKLKRKRIEGEREICFCFVEEE